LISPYIRPAVVHSAANKKTSDRMANTKGTAAKSPCKGKTAPREKYCLGASTGCLPWRQAFNSITMRYLLMMR